MKWSNKVSNFGFKEMLNAPDARNFKNQIILNYSGPVFTVEDREQAAASLHMPARLSFACYIYCLEGRGTFKISGKEYSIVKQDLLFISGGSIMEDMSFSDDYSFASINFTPEGLTTSTTLKSLQFLRDHMLEPGILHLTKEKFDNSMGLFLYIRKILNHDDYAFRDDAILAAITMFACFFSNTVKETGRKITVPEIQWKRNELIRQFLNSVSIHYLEERTVSEYAIRLGVTPKYLAQMVFKVTGKHAKDWIRDFVIKDARTMLRSGTCTVQEVSAALRFPNQSFFAKYYRSATGKTPKQEIAESQADKETKDF